MVEITITVLWHVFDEFYNVRIPVGMKTISQSTMRMRSKIYNVEGVNWNYHVILTLDDSSIKKIKDGIDSKILSNCFKKTKEVFGADLTSFWKYEEGRESERPHFHLLFDLKETEESDKVIEKMLEVSDIYQFVENQKKYKMNLRKSDKEIIMGYLFFKIWGNGITHARRIKNEMELVTQVEKDIAKRTGTEGFKPNKRKYGFSKGIKIKKRLKKGEYEWVGNRPLYEAKELLESTKENFIKSFSEKSYDGAIVYTRTLEDLDKYEKSKKMENKDLKDITIQKRFNVDKLMEKIKETKEAIRK